MIPSVPKPPASVKAARKPLKRSSPLKAGKPLAKSTKPLKKAGETKRKKVAKQKAYYASAGWKAKRKAALERAGNQCEYEAMRYVGPMTPIWKQYLGISASLGNAMAAFTRCAETERLHVHHKTNVRFGGNELDKDLIVYCQDHHDLVETRDFPHRQRNR